MGGYIVDKMEKNSLPAPQAANTAPAAPAAEAAVPTAAAPAPVPPQEIKSEGAQQSGPAAPDPVEAQYLALEKKVLAYNPGVNCARLRAAYEYARACHGEQIRKDGSPFVTHPLAAADIVADMGLDEDSLIAALLHDCVEDTACTLEDITKRFGPAVAALVDGVTKLTRVVYTSKEEEQMENLRKMLMAMAKDIRVILIKIADRLHNMRTMAYQSVVKQKEKALETMEIYAPIAHRLGMQKVKWELEDLSLLYLDPIGYKEISDALANMSVAHEEFMRNTKKRIEDRMAEAGIHCTVTGRTKHLYSIYRKMYSQNKTLTEVFDLYAFRVIVDNIADCYNVLGHIHDLFKPIPGRFKDYIGTPKPNMYQSLHTTVIGSDGVPFEVQIRTWDMHHTAEYGIAAHWKYKQGLVGKLGDEEKFAWIRSLLEAQQDSDASDFVHDLKIDMFADEVFVFTPQGDVINLPAGATPIDFAYSIHSAIGNRMTGATVNGRIVPFSHVLKNGDIVEVLTSASSKGPSRDWLTLAKSSEARSKIKQWFKKEKREENIAHGRAAFEAELKRAGLSMAEVTAEGFLPIVLKRMAVAELDDMFAAIGYGGMTALKCVNRIRDELVRAAHTRNKPDPRLPKNQAEPAPTQSIHGILVEGLDNCLVKFSRCCTPVPGDDIVGFITRGYGVSIHRKDCQNYLNSQLHPNEAGRWIPVSWTASTDEFYHTSLNITAKDRAGLVMDVATLFNTLKTRVRSLSARSVDGGNALVFVSLDVKDKTELNNIMSRLMSVPAVISVKRAAS